MPKHELLSYRLQRDGGGLNPDYREIQRGPLTYIYENLTGRLFKYIGTDPVVCNERITVEPVVDDGLRRLVLDGDKPPVPTEKYLGNRFLVRQ